MKIEPISPIYQIPSKLPPKVPEYKKQKKKEELPAGHKTFEEILKDTLNNHQTEN